MFKIYNVTYVTRNNLQKILFKFALPDSATYPRDRAT